MVGGEGGVSFGFCNWFVEQLELACLLACLLALFEGGVGVGVGGGG